MKINSEIAELIGAHIGDGSMGLYKGRHIISFAGHPLEDKQYTEWVLDVYSRYFNVNPRLRKWSRILGFQNFSKEIFNFYKSLGIPSGRKLNIDIPSKIRNSDKQILAACIRGIFDTDGTLYFEHKKSGHYPRIQLKITSENLSETVRNLLNKKFHIGATLYSRKERDNWKTSYFVEIRGKDNLEKWTKEIGFRNIKNISKIELWKRNINPQQPFDIRIKILNMGS